MNSHTIIRKYRVSTSKCDAWYAESRSCTFWTLWFTRNVRTSSCSKLKIIHQLSRRSALRIDEINEKLDMFDMLTDVLMHQNEKTLNFSVVNACKLDYSVTFRDAQDLKLVWRKLLKASLILRSSVNVERFLKTHIEEVARTLQQSKISGSLEMLNQYAASLEMHARIVNALLKRLSEISKLISDTRSC